MSQSTEVATAVPCYTMNPEIWFDTSRKGIAQAKSLCGICPRKLPCLEDTVTTERLMGSSIHGVHAGLTPAERRKLSTVKRIS